MHNLLRIIIMLGAVFVCVRFLSWDLPKQAWWRCGQKICGIREKIMLCEVMVRPWVGLIRNGSRFDIFIILPAGKNMPAAVASACWDWNCKDKTGYFTHLFFALYLSHTPTGYLWSGESFFVGPKKKKKRDSPRDLQSTWSWETKTSRRHNNTNQSFIFNSSGSSVLLLVSTAHNFQMSFLGFGGAPQPTSAQKLAMAEMEMDIMAHMMNKYATSRGNHIAHWELMN